MFRQRNRQFDFKGLIETALNCDFKSCLLKTLLKGRMLNLAASWADIIPRDYDDLIIRIIDLAISFMQEVKTISVKLAATRCLIKFSRRLKKQDMEANVARFHQVLDDLIGLLHSSHSENVYLPIDAISQFSRINEEAVANIAPKCTPSLMRLFREYHSDGTLGYELLNLFKVWTPFESVRSIFTETFLPFIIEIVDNYYSSTPNLDNKDARLKMQAASDDLDDLNRRSKIVDSSTLQHILELLQVLIKKAGKDASQQKRIVATVFP